MAISMTVRNACIDDIPEIIELAKKFHAVSGYECLEFDCDTVERIVMQSIDQELCPVAVIDGEVVGFLLGLQFPALLNANIMVGTEIAWWVEPRHRSKPIGVKLLKYIEKVKLNFFQEKIELVEIKYEVPEEESDEFIQLL